MPRKREEDGGMEPEVMEALMNIIVIYYNHFIPAFPDGRTPAEAAGIEAPDWLKPLIQQYKEPLDKQAVQEFTGDRFARLAEEIVSEVQKNGASTRRGEAILKIIETGVQALLSERGFPPSSEPPEREEETTSQSLKDVTFVIPFTTVYRVSNVKKCRRKIHEYMEQEHGFDSNGCRIEILKDAPQEGAEAFVVLSYDKSDIGIKLGSMGLLGNNITVFAEKRDMELTAEEFFGERG
jgi:hypothetical protein